MTDPTEHIRQINAHHRNDDRHDGAGRPCGCGAEGLSDHWHHLAHEIIDRFGLTQESAGDPSRKIRYNSASTVLAWSAAPLGGGVAVNCGQV